MRASVVYMMCIPAPYFVVVARQISNTTKKTWSETLLVTKWQYYHRGMYPSYEQQPIAQLKPDPAVDEFPRPETQQYETDRRDSAYQTTCYDIWDKRIIGVCLHVGYLLGGR